jgi:hypothetical protein
MVIEGASTPKSRACQLLAARRPGLPVTWSGGRLVVRGSRARSPGRTLRRAALRVGAQEDDRAVKTERPDLLEDE